MVVFPVMVAFHTADWLPIAVESYLSQFPEDRLLIVDNNPRPGETGWSAACRRESRWLHGHSRIDVIKPSTSYTGAPVPRGHGAGMDLAVEWCRSRAADVMLHIEPDCLITGRAWRDNLVRAIEQGAWMAGSLRKPWGPIHPTPSAWLVREVRTSFDEQSKTKGMVHPRYCELVDVEILRAASEPASMWDWARETWDTADKAWFDAAIHGKAALVEAPGFRHFWFGTSAHSLPLDQLIDKFPEIASWLAQRDAETGARRVDGCLFRQNVRQGAQSEIAACKLIQQLSGTADTSLSEVRREVCEHCCESAVPSHTFVNPAIASHLYRLADRIVDSGGVEGCTAESAWHLRSFAETFLDLRLPDEGSSPAPRRRDRACQHLGAEVGSRIVPNASGYERRTVFICRHPDHFETTNVECRRCRDYTDGPFAEPISIERLVPRPNSRFGQPVRHWAVGVTTAPRPQSTLGTCLDSLARAGWEVARLFVDSAVTIPDRFSELPVTFHETKLGAWPNYYLALVELLMREPKADAFMLVQDDVIFDDRHDIKAYLEDIMWPADPIGAVSLYCPKAYTRPQDGWHALEGAWVWGALAFLFPRESAKRFVTDSEVFEHRSDPTQGLAKIDIEIGRWAYANRLPIYFPSPSLVQHIGDSSSLWTAPQSRAMGDRRANRFAGDIV